MSEEGKSEMGAPIAFVRDKSEIETAVGAAVGDFARLTRAG